MKEYDPKDIESKWQKEWEKAGIYQAGESSDKPKKYILDMFPYPSGEGLHVGHPKGYIATDVFSRTKRMQGHNVLHPMGWDAFGLPAENFAIANKIHPKEAVTKNITRFKEQLSKIGFDYDWSREINTTDPDFYKWTQWIFLKLLEKGLAYESYEPINWCPSCQTGLANEDVEDGRCERCGTVVEKKPMRQWMLRITDYADRLLNDLSLLPEWQEHIKESQRNWIGRSEGALIKFGDYEVFTTRPDTIFGATFIAISGKEDRFTGKYVANPATKEQIPVWEAEYVMSDYGTGAIMGVPSDDERDRIFAEKHNLPVAENYEKAEFEDFGKKVTRYKLRDWVFSRQRYWGEPIPVVHCEKDGVVPVPEKDLPVKLPEVEHYAPTGTGESPLANIEEWVNTTCPKCGGPAKRETNTMPQWAGSSWYYLRYTDTENQSALVDKKKEKYWAPVDLYVGGAEHATRHLIYARFWHKFLFDMGVASTEEPFERLISVGLILAEDGRKMSKRWGNVINPDDVVDRFGADSLRVYEMFMGPFENAIAWSANGLVGARRFIERVWRIREKITEDAGLSAEDERLTHQTIKKVSEDVESFKFNTCISSMMILVNALEKRSAISRQEYETLLLLLAPFAPHVTEELWHELGHDTSIHLEKWPVFDEAKVLSEEVTVAVQVGGKLKGTVNMERGAAEAEVFEKARLLPAVSKEWEREVARVVFVPDRLINIIFRP